MAYNTKPIITDSKGNPISQYYNKELDQYEPVEGANGANKVLVENNDLSLIPILDKLSQLTGTVIDEETRKSNELQRQELYNQIFQMLEDGELKGDKGDTGNGLEFNWQGTSLGVREEGQIDYVYVDLQGPQGPQGPPGTIENLTSQHIEDALGYIPATTDSVDTVQQELNEHIKDIYENEVHGMRIINGKLEYWDAEEEKWKQIAGGGGSQVPLGNVENFTAEPDDGKVILRWKDPEDIVVDGIVISKWAGTKILRKTGSYPANENDGVLVVDSGVRNQYEIDGFVDTGLENNIEYFYMAFPYTTDGLYTLDIANRVSAMPTDYDDLTGSPGSPFLIAGDMQEGFFGEVPSSELITGDALASLVGISQGTSQHSTAGWLKFAWKGNIQFVAKKPIRHSISWDAINTAKCVYGDSGDKTVEIGGLTYKVRLMRALEPSNDPKTVASAYNGTVNHYSEWNRLMCQIHEQAIDKSWDYPDNIENDIGILEHNLGSGRQGMYSDADLVVKSGDGRASWCQEMGTSTSYRFHRGSIGVSNSNDNSSSDTGSYYGWRPVLELIPSTEPTDPNTWADVQDIVRQGLANEYFSVGDQLVSAYDGGEIIWEVIGIDVDTPADSRFTHSMTIQTKDCLHDIQFDAPESNNPNSDRKSYGNNRYIHSAVRQWLNSDESTFTWESQHSYDAKPNNNLDLYDGAGFLYRLDPELVAVLGTVNKKVAKANVDGGGQDTFTDKVFLLSQKEVGLGEEGDVTGEFVYPFYDGISNAGRIKQLNGSNRTWWLRSPYVSHSYLVRSVFTDGSLNYNSASITTGVSPACVII